MPQNTLSSTKLQHPGLLTIHGQSGILDGLGIIAFGVLSLYFASHGVILLISGIILLIFGLLLLLLAIPQVGKPILRLSREGFETPGFGFIPWNYVQGIDKQEREHRGIKFSPILTFYVPDLKMFGSQFHGIHRLFSNKNRISLILRHTDMKPDAILSVARQLWTERTGFDHTWSAYSSDEVNEAYRRISETMKRERALLDSCWKAAEDKNNLKVENVLQQVESNWTELKSDWGIIAEARNKSKKLLLIISAISIFLFVLYVVLKVRHLLHI